MSTAVSWDTAQKVAAWVASGRPPFATPAAALDTATRAELDDDFAWATTKAETLVVEATGLVPSGPAKAAVVDRSGWVANNLVSFQTLLGPVLHQLETTPMGSSMAAVARNVTGAQLGVVLGWMSTRVLGQYDILLAEGDTGDAVSYVGPNIVAMERRHGFPPRQFRLWIALHEVTHRCQFTGVPWLHGHFLSLVNEGLSSVNTDPRRFAQALKRAAGTVRQGRNPLDDAGLLGLVAGPEQLEVLQRVQAFMSLLEGHGDVTMDRAGAAALPEAPWFAHTLRQRRARASAPARLFQQLIGLDAKLRQYQQGERFIAEVESAGGEELFRRVWDGPEQLPSLEEIREPRRWVARVAAAGTAVS